MAEIDALIASKVRKHKKVELQPQKIKFDQFSSSIRQIVFGAFHYKIGSIILYPICEKCYKKLDLKKTVDKAHREDFSEQSYELTGKEYLQITNCSCALSENLSRPRVITHLNSALMSDGFKYVSDGFTYASWRWVFNVETAKRREILFCIIIYFDSEVPIFKKELNCVETFLKNFTSSPKLYLRHL